MAKKKDKKGKSPFAKGQYWAIRLRGSDNGDLILGRLESYRTDGHVHMINQLTGNDSFKQAKDILNRNVRISAKDAKELIRLWKKSGDKLAVRERAVKMWEEKQAKQEEAKKVRAQKKEEKKSGTNIITPLHIPRLPWPQFFMLHAHLAATRSTCDRGPELLLDPGRHGVGAVIVKDHRVIAGGYNGSPPGQPHCSDPEGYHECSVCGYRKTPDDPKGMTCPSCGPKSLDEGGQSWLWKEGGHIMRDGHCVRTIHSEMNALIQCALDGTSPEGASIYCTASPCWDCGKALIRAKIKCVYVGQAYDSRYGLSGDVSKMLEDSGVHVEYIQLKWQNGSLQGTRYIEEE